VDANPIVAINLMLEHHIDCLLVRNEQGKLAGIVTTRDFMKMVLLFHRVCTRSQELERLRLIDLDASRGLPVDVLFSRGARSVRDVMTKDLKCLSETDSIEMAMATMQKHALRHLPVVDSSMRLLGMVSDRQILRALPLPVPNYDPRRQYGFRDVLFAVRDSKPLKQSVATIMNTKPTLADPASHLVDSIDVMVNQTISGVAVVDPHHNRLCGILTATDILRVFRVALQIGSHVAPHSQGAPERCLTPSPAARGLLSGV
jgi:CBS domain-containing protein